VAKERDTYKYQFKEGNKVVHRGITNDLDRREGEHKSERPEGHIKQVGRKTTREAALRWERDGGKRSVG
jgi:predicted GIY-YIG superfamily endonuclease